MHTAIWYGVPETPPLLQVQIRQHCRFGGALIQGHQAAAVFDVALPQGGFALFSAEVAGMDDGRQVRLD